MWCSVFLNSLLIFSFVRVVDAFGCVNVLSLLSLKKKHIIIAGANFYAGGTGMSVCVDL